MPTIASPSFRQTRNDSGLGSRVRRCQAVKASGVAGAATHRPWSRLLTRVSSSSSSRSHVVGTRKKTRSPTSSAEDGRAMAGSSACRGSADKRPIRWPEPGRARRRLSPRRRPPALHHTPPRSDVKRSSWTNNKVPGRAATTRLTWPDYGPNDTKTQKERPLETVDRPCDSPANASDCRPSSASVSAGGAACHAGGRELETRSPF